MASREITGASHSVHLSVNVAPDVAAALKELAQRHRSSLTEEVRRAISLYKFADDEQRQGNRVLIQRGDSMEEIWRLR